MTEKVYSEMTVEQLGKLKLLLGSKIQKLQLELAYARSHPPSIKCSVDFKKWRQETLAKLQAALLEQGDVAQEYKSRRSVDQSRKLKTDIVDLLNEIKRYKFTNPDTVCLIQRLTDSYAKQE